ncbi:MAG: YncE family protein, partial [Bacteroidales bacterium]|nr:YncE family protein [Bacteroidales bacterium]
MRKILNVLSVVFLSCLFIACNPEEEPELVNYASGKGVFICNEGNYSYGNSSISFFDPEKKEISNYIFYNANGFTVGDVCQSMCIIDSLGFLVINNSGKILVINTHTFKHEATITGLSSPRYMARVSDSLAYVTDLYSPFISIINVQSFKKTGEIKVGRSTEGIVKKGDFVYVSSWSFQNKVYKINCQSKQIVDSLTVTKQPNSLVIDRNNKLWVLSDGGFQGIPGGQEIAALTRIEVESFEVEKVFRFQDISLSPQRLNISQRGDLLFFVVGGWKTQIVENGGVFVMNVNDSELPSQPFIEQDVRLFYGLGIDPSNSVIYVSDAIDFMQQGWIF